MSEARVLDLALKDDELLTEQRILEQPRGLERIRSKTQFTATGH